MQLLYNKRIHLIILIVLPLLVFIKSVSYDFIGFDDNGIISDNIETLKDISKIDTVFKSDAFLHQHGDFYRPVQTLTYMLDAQISKEKPWMYHLSNVLIHVLTCVSLYYFLIFFRFSALTAFLLASLFSVHPLFGTAVAWVPARGDILIGLLGVLLFISFGKFVQTGKTVFFGLHVLLFALCLFTKETTVLFPLFLVYYYLLILKKPVHVKTALLFFTAWILCFAGYYLLRKNVVENTTTVDVFGLIPFLKNNPVIPTIAGKFFIPQGLSTLPLYNNLSTIIGIASLILIAYLTFEYSRHSRWQSLMGLMWFILFVIPPAVYRLENASCFFTYLEHRTYLPIIGILLLLGSLLDDLVQKKWIGKLLVIHLVVLCVFGWMAFNHAEDYKDNFSFSNGSAVQNNPTGLQSRARWYFQRKQYDKALTDLNKAIDLCPNASMYFERGKLKSVMNDHRGSLQDFTLALTYNPQFTEALVARSIEQRKNGNRDAALKDMYMAMKQAPYNPAIYFSYGNLMVEKQSYQDALEAYNKAIDMNSDYADALNNRAFVKIQLNDFAGAVKDCYGALAVKPVFALAYSNLGTAYRELNKSDSAFFCFNKGIAIDSSVADAYFGRGLTWLKIGAKQSACKDFTTAYLRGYAAAKNYADASCK